LKLHSNHRRYSVDNKCDKDWFPRLIDLFTYHRAILCRCQ